VPATAVVHTWEELTEWLVKNGGPAVLKTDGSFGGRGVRVVRTFAEARRAWQALSVQPSLGLAIKRAVVNRDMNHVVPCISRARPVVNVQAFVSGQDANCTVACWKGTILASITACVLETLDPQGPASVIRLVENREISAAVELIVRELRLSGLIGVDFLLDSHGTGNAHLIEMNPRASQIGHLQLGRGRDVPGALRAVLSGEPPRRAARVTESETIALFPQEWLRDPTSSFLRTAYHDVPWEEPDLVRLAIHEPMVQRVWSGLSRRVRQTRARIATGLSANRVPDVGPAKPRGGTVRRGKLA
jgi:hypothetical protein